jgi:hypothetical protein
MQPVYKPDHFEYNSSESPRALDPVKQQAKLHFIVLPDKNRRCIHCAHVVTSKNLERLISHLRTCTVLPETDKEIFRRGPDPSLRRKRLDMDMLDTAVFDFFRITGLPIEIADSHAFTGMLKIARPSYSPPTSARIQTVLSNIQTPHSPLN